MSLIRPGAEGGPFDESTFKTIEFGFSPFVPFSEVFKMILGGGKGGESDFQVYAQSVPDQQVMTDDWQAIYDAYNKGGRDTLKDLDNIPTTQIQAKAEEMTKELAALLQGKSPIYSKYDTKEKAELEDMIAIEWLMDPNNDMGWEGDTWKVKGVHAPDRVLGIQVQSSSKETIDMMATTAAKQKQLEFVIHRIAANVEGGVGFVKDAEGAEVTKMIHKKYTQKLFNEVTGIEDINARWNKVGEDLQKNMRKMFDIAFKVSDNIVELSKKGRVKVFAGRPGVSKKDDAQGYDTAEYMAMQMIDRFAEIAKRTKKNLGVYLWQEPLVIKVGSAVGSGVEAAADRPGVHSIRYVVGLARFQVTLKRVGKKDSEGIKMSNLAVETRTVDLSEKIEAAGFTDVAEFLKYLDAASDVGYGTLSQFLIVDNMRSQNLGKAALIEGANALGIGLGKWASVTGQKGELLGSSFRYQVDNIARGAVGGAGSVEAVQVLTSAEVAKRLKGKFEAFFESKEMKGKFEAFYKKARTQANEVTDDWKTKVGVDNMQLSDAENVWAKDLYPEGGGGITGAKMGLPWFFYSGQDPQGYLRFKVRSVNKMLLANIRRDIAMSGIGTQPAKPLQAIGASQMVKQGLFAGDVEILGKQVEGGTPQLAGDWYESGAGRFSEEGVVKGKSKALKDRKTLDWRETVIPN